MFKPEGPFYIKARIDPQFFYWLRQLRKACSLEQMQKGLGVLRELISQLAIEEAPDLELEPLSVKRFK